MNNMEFDFIEPIKDIYNNNDLYPINQVTIKKTNIIRGNKIVTLAVFPVALNPVKNELEFSSKIDIIIRLKSTEKVPLTSMVVNKTEFDNYLKDIVDNDTDVDKFSVIQEKGRAEESGSLKSVNAINGIPIYCEYVIITPSSFASSFNDLIKWKRQKGIDIELVTTEAISQNYTGDLISGIYDEAGKVRQFLYEAYQNGLEYALLGGECNTVPIRYGTGSNNNWTSSVTNDYKIPADLYFSDFDGDWNVDSDQYLGEITDDDVDYGPEIFVGRLLVNSPSDVETWTDKLEWYEKDPGFGDPSYLLKAFFTQADEMQSLNQAYDIVSHFNNFFSTNTVYEEMYNGVANPNSAASPQFPTGSDVVSEMNGGYGFISWFNHGSPNNIAVGTKGYNDCGGDDKKKVTNYDYVQGWCGYVENDNGLEDVYNSVTPFILYTISCETTPFDAWNNVAPSENMGARIIDQQGRGGPIYLGNTRYGYIGDSWYTQQDFTDLLVSGTYRLGVAEANSKASYGNHYICLSHNLLGCPEVEIWSATPSQFSSAYITDYGTTVYVNTGGVSNCTISIISSTDNGASYLSVLKNASQGTFYNVPNSYIVTITKHNYIPRIFQ